MNNANTKIRDQTAINAINTALLLLKMEGDRFEEQCQDAWSDRNGDLIPIILKIFNEINQMPISRFWVSTEEKASEYVRIVKDIQGRLIEETVTVPKDDTFGSRFGKCSCRTMQTDSMPCIHMAVVAKSFQRCRNI